MSDNTPMTAEQILAMVPGREMDKMAVTEVLGWEWVDESASYSEGIVTLEQCYAVDSIGEPHFEFSPSTDIAAAWVIVEKMQGIREFNGKKVRLQVTVSAIRGTYTALISDYLNDRVIAEQMGSTAPEAICRAALLARLEGLNP